MKKILLVLSIILAASTVEILDVWACDKGCEKFKDTCVCNDATPYFGTPVQPSDEKPPSDKMPSYQREGVQVVSAPNTATLDEHFDKEKADADAEGKRAAGIKPKKKTAGIR